MIDDGGSIYTCGAGIGSPLEHHTPKIAPHPLSPTGERANIVQIALGASHMVLLDAEGRVYTFGSNDHGQLGHGDRETRRAPTLLALPPPLARIVQIAAGDYHTVLLDSEGRVYTFGNGHNGELGLGDCEGRLAPARVEMLTGGRIVLVSANASRNAVVSEDGHIYAWGCYYESCGDDRHPDLRPDLVGYFPPALGRIVQVLAFGDSTFMLTDAGLVYACPNEPGNREHRLAPVAVPTLLTQEGGQPFIVQIAVGSNHAILLDRDGRVFTVGDNQDGQLGHGDRDRRDAPTLVTLPSTVGRVVRISGGECHSVLLDADGNVYTCGLGAYGALCHGDYFNRYALTKVACQFDGGIPVHW